MRRVIFPVLLGVAGLAVLLSLGIWQLQRLAWKEAILAEIDARIVADPVALPETPTLESDPYLPVTVTGDLTGEEVHVLTSQDGPGYRIIAVMQTADARRIMVDLGFVPETEKDAPRIVTGLTVTGNLHWPDEADGWTPEPDAANIWFARDVPRAATALETEPVLVVARSVDGGDPGTLPLPIASASISNDHLNYAITWFLLAAVWLVMTIFLILRTRRTAPAGPRLKDD